LELAFQLHPGGACTSTAPVAPAAANAWLLSGSENVQVVPPCTIVKLAAPTAIDAIRLVPAGFTATL
jgi:hypothetical protein